MTLREKLEEVFDPTDASKAQAIANRALLLAARAHYAIVTDNHNLRMGRDQKMNLGVAITELVQEMGLLNRWCSAEEHQKLMDELHSEGA